MFTEVIGASAVIPPISAETSTLVEYYATDNAGNAESTHSLTVCVDLTAPTTTATIVGSLVTLSATDSLSGVAATYYSIDGGGAQTYSAPFTASASGSHTLQYWSIDVAGNPENPLPAVTFGADTYITVTSVSGLAGQKKNLTARLRRSSNNQNIANATIVFKVDGTIVGTDTTSNGGTASVSYTLPEAVGTQTFTAEYAGDSSLDPSSGSGTVTATFASTVITVPDKVMQAADTINLTATLKRVGDGAIENKTLTFKVDGAVIGTAITNGSGVAHLSYTAPAATGVSAITVEFAGNSAYGASTGTAALTITKADTKLAVTNRTVKVNKPTTLTARIHRVSDGAYLDGLMVKIYVDGEWKATLATEGGGYVNLSYTPTTTGVKTITAQFDGDSVHNASSDTGTLTVN